MHWQHQTSLQVLQKIYKLIIQMSFVILNFIFFTQIVEPKANQLYLMTHQPRNVNLPIMWFRRN